MQQNCYRYHWFAFWKPLSAGCLLIVLGTLALLDGGLLGLLFYSVAALLCMAIYVWWRWRRLTFTHDHRLSRRRGLFGRKTDVISLFGVITPYQLPVVGPLLDVGSVHLGIPGPDIHIRHIANFRAFCHDLLHDAAQQAPQAAQPTVIQVHVHMPPALQPLDNWLNRLPQGQAGNRHGR